jgi:HlyD family secretion protein
MRRSTTLLRRSIRSGAASRCGSPCASAPRFLKPDMTVSIDLTVAAKQHVLTLPSEAVRGAATPSPRVFAVEGGRLVDKDVRLGIHGDVFTEATSGIEQGALVAMPEGQLFAAGQRVRAEHD